MNRDRMFDFLIAHRNEGPAAEWTSVHLTVQHARSHFGWARYCGSGVRRRLVWGLQQVRGDRGPEVARGDARRRAGNAAAAVEGGGLHVRGQAFPREEGGDDDPAAAIQDLYPTWSPDGESITFMS